MDIDSKTALRAAAVAGIVGATLSAMVGINMHDGALFGMATAFAAICAGLREVTK